MAVSLSNNEDPFKDTHKYVKIKTVGSGSFGLVLLSKNIRHDEQVAIKLLKRADVNKYVTGEIINHSLLRHPHIIQFKEVFLTPEYICIAMEYASGGSLFQYVQKAGRLKEGVARWFFQQLIMGVDYSHKRGVANRDIKLENALLHEVPGLPLPLLKICDFGLSKADYRSAAKSKVGTYTYMAPEVLERRPGQTYEAKYADIWSCGVMLYVMLVGGYPFKISDTPTPKDMAAMLDAMERKAYAIPSHVQISPECRNLLDAMLEPSPAKRIRMEEVMAHPFFLANLPPSAVQMNDTYLKTPFPPGYQSPDDIQAILAQARS